MQRWRFIPFVTLALALLACLRLPAQDAAKKSDADAALPHGCAPPASAAKATAAAKPSDHREAPHRVAEKEFQLLRVHDRPGLRTRREDRALGRPGHRGRGLGLCPWSGQPGGSAPTRERRRCARSARRSAREPTPIWAGSSRRSSRSMVVLTGLFWATAESTEQVALGRAAAFFMGATFSWLVGFVGMSLAVRGNLRVAAAARTSYGAALQLGYRTGTITGMLTDGLGLLGGTLIFMVYGEHAYEVLLGFGFGGTLLALFMRVGGGIYTKAADVGADLVGKVEAGIPEDDPRNAATIADNVGDNVGDCAGMAADIFESYEVTIVAAMILGYASFGHKGVIFPLLVRAIGVLGSIWSTYTVKAGPDSTSDEALHSVHHGFVLGSIFSVVGFVLLGFGYLHFDKTTTPSTRRRWRRQLTPIQSEGRSTDNRTSHEDPSVQGQLSEFIRTMTATLRGGCRSGPASAPTGSTCGRPGPA